MEPSIAILGSKAPSPTTTHAGRIAFIDLARSVAIGLAMLSHAMLVFGVYEHLPLEVRKATLVLVHTAAPTFVLLFGAMLEIVYVRKIERHGTRGPYARLRRRGLQCYLGFALTIVAAVGSGRMSTDHAMLAAVSLAPSQLGSALKFYTVALLAAPILLWIRRRWGVAAVLVLVGLYWLATPLLDRLPWPAASQPLAHLTGLLTGYPKGVAYISMGHVLTLVGAGMLLGWSLRRDTAAGTRWRYWAVVVAMMGVAAVVVAILGWQLGLRKLLGSYASGFRKVHHVGYYALGLIQALGLISLLRCLVPLSVPEDRIWRPALVFGQHSLLTFAVGNAMLLALPPLDLSLRAGLASSVVFVAILDVALLAYSRRQRPRKAPAGPHEAVRSLQAGLRSAFLSRKNS